LFLFPNIYYKFILLYARVLYFPTTVGLRVRRAHMYLSWDLRSEVAVALDNDWHSVS